MVDDHVISESKKIETFLKQSIDKILPVVNAAGMGFWSWDIKNNEIYFDKQCIQIVGYKEGEITNNRFYWEDCIHPDDKARVKKALENYLKELAPEYKIEYRIRTKSGNYIWILDSGNVIEWDNKRKPLKFIGILYDINDKRVSRELLQESEERYKSIFEHLNDAFCRFNFNGTILDVNKNLCDLIGIKAKDLNSSNIKLFFSNKTIKFLHRRLSNILENKSISFETEIVTPNKKVLPVSISARLITASGDGVVQALIRDITERKTYEKAILEEKQTFKALIENSPNLIARFGRNLKCQYITPNIFTIIGISAENCLGKRIAEITCPPNLASYIETKMKWVLRRNKEVTVSFSFEALKGLRYFETTMVPEANGTETVESILTTTSDITDKVNSERELNFSRQKLEEAEKNVHFGVYEINLTTGQALWSNEMYMIFERDTQLPPPMLNDYCNEYVHPDDFEEVNTHCQEILKNALNFNYIYRIITHGGNIKYINNVGKVELNAETGEPSIMQGTIMDITEKKQIENRLFLERDILQAIIDNVPDAVYIKDYQGHYICANKGLANLVGCEDPYKMIGKTVFDFFPKDVADKIYENEQSIFSSGAAIINQEREIAAPRGRVWLSATIVGVKDATGKVTQLVGISRDITQYKHVESQLRKAIDKAEQADKLKSAFLANMSHEIRTPINGILGFASLMEMKVFPREKEVQYLRIINSSGKLLLGLINDIIDIAKIEAGQINIETSEVDINCLLTDLCDFYQGEKIKKEKQHIEIKCLLPEKPLDHSVITDPFRLKQIINNLISNALKFTEEGTIEFGYKVEQDLVIFFVKDTGLGLSADEIKVIFQRFKQTGRSDKKKEGTGLGLAISRGLVELLGGKIYVKSRVGLGSEFFFNIPLQSGNSNSLSVAENDQSIVLPEYKWDDKTLLLVEDEEVNYRYIYDVLEESEINILHVTTAEEAISICRTSQKIDIILMDMRLPGINGFDATRIIKKLRSDIPIIAQTAYAMENERKECFDAGCDEYLTKPFEQTILLKVLNTYLLNPN
jgi:PAS domain S-box-containing protein